MNIRLNAMPSALSIVVMLGASAALLGSSATVCAHNNQNAPERRRCVIVEVFVDQNRQLDQELEARVKQFAVERGGMLLTIRKLQDGEAGGKRLAQITSHFKIDSGNRPLLYCLNRAIHSKSTVEEYLKAIERALQLEVFVRVGCSRCDAAKLFLTGYASEYPALELVYRDISQDNLSVQELNQLVAKHRRAAASVPVIHVCDELLVGYSSDQTSRNQLDGILMRWTKNCPQKPSEKEVSRSAPDAALTRGDLLKPEQIVSQSRYSFFAVSGVTALRPFSPSSPLAAPYQPT